jgi:hypothetical protein
MKEWIGMLYKQGYDDLRTGRIPMGVVTLFSAQYLIIEEARRRSA